MTWKLKYVKASNVKRNWCKSEGLL